MATNGARGCGGAGLGVDWLLVRWLVLGAVVVVAFGLSVSAAGAAAPAGGVLAFGGNSDGQLGSATNDGTNDPNATPTLVALPGQVGPATQVAVGGHSLVLTATGQLYGFGDNFFGQLGSSANTGTNNPNPTPTVVTLPGEIGPVIRIAAGSDHSLAVTASGQLYAFGFNTTVSWGARPTLARVIRIRRRRW